MSGSIQLNSKNLPFISNEVIKPKYDRKNVKTGIVHIGVGNFHRSHEAFYTDEVLNTGDLDWGICGIGLLRNDSRMYKILMNQDGLYTLMVSDSEGHLNARIIGSIAEYHFAPDNKEAVLKKMADPEVRIISLTITEGGYNFDSSTGDFKFNEPNIQWDMQHPDHPKTVFGYLTQALIRRKDYGLPGMTILSCDNIQKNGDVCKKMLTEFIHAAEPGLLKWVESNCSFPNSMVDRITPVTKSWDIEKLKNQYGYLDSWPVHCEPFIQWILEDDFSNSRPEWESSGVQFVSDVGPYERLKIRLLNAGHSLLGLSGSLCGFHTIDETVRDPLFESFLRKFMNYEVTPILEPVEGINLKEYKDSLIYRFSNQNINDRLSRICAESSDKIPKFLLPTIKDQLDRGGPIILSTLVIASWCRYMELAGTSGNDYEVQDILLDELKKAALDSQRSNPLSFLNIKSIFGNLVDSNRFTDTYLDLITMLRNNGIRGTILKVINND